MIVSEGIPKILLGLNNGGSGLMESQFIPHWGHSVYLGPKSGASIFPTARPHFQFRSVSRKSERDLSWTTRRTRNLGTEMKALFELPSLSQVAKLDSKDVTGNLEDETEL